MGDHPRINLPERAIHECCAKHYVEYLPCNTNIGLSWRWGRLLIVYSSLYIFILEIGIRGCGRCVLLSPTKTWKNTRINIARPILTRLKEKCFLPDFSITCTSKAKAVVGNKQLSLLQPIINNISW